MKYILLLILIMCASIVKAQPVEINYSHTSEPFRWIVKSIESTDQSTYVTLSVTNMATGIRIVNFIQGEYAYNSKNPNGVKATGNSIKFSNNSKNLSLAHGYEVEFVLTFPTPSIGSENSFDLKIGKFFKLSNIQIPEITLSQINQKMQTWEEFYRTNKRLRLTFRNAEDVKRAIAKGVEDWQKKGEFESTSAWKTRVTDSSRQEYIADLTQKYSSQYQSEISQMQSEQTVLAKQYEEYKEGLLNQYYARKISRATNNFDRRDFELKPYDADNETFLIHSKTYGDILLPVPLNEAPTFKLNWNSIARDIEPVFVPNGEDVALSKLIFKNYFNKYEYDSHTTAKYAITDINYNFAPIEVAEINFSDLKIDGYESQLPDVSSSIVSLAKSNSTISPTVVSQSRRSINASEKSDIDIAIPHNTTNNSSTTFAVVIANEKYNSVAPVPFAENDGKIFAKYLTNAIGLPENHVKLYTNATYGNMAAALKHIDNLSSAFGNQLNLIFYYAGHGMPNEKTKQCMIMPVDADASIPETCYDVEKLYSSLGKLNANSIVVMMDACFSGSERGNGMLMAARSVKIKTNQSKPQGNMVILSASQGDETAFPFDKEQHGLFTYYLLKKIQENNGRVSLGELSDYLVEQVKRQSVITNGKLQTPFVLASEAATDWRSWNFSD